MKHLTRCCNSWICSLASLIKYQPVSIDAEKTPPQRTSLFSYLFIFFKLQISTQEPQLNFLWHSLLLFVDVVLPFKHSILVSKWHCPEFQNQCVHGILNIFWMSMMDFQRTAFYWCYSHTKWMAQRENGTYKGMPQQSRTARKNTNKYRNTESYKLKKDYKWQNKEGQEYWVSKSCWNQQQPIWLT